MDSTGLVFTIVAGAAVLALWVDQRFRRLEPGGVFAHSVHVAAAVVVLMASPAVIQPIIAEGTSPPRTMVALFAIFLPSLVYAFLTGIWFMRLVQSAMSAR
jgi:hypothetical protein